MAFTSKNSFKPLTFEDLFAPVREYMAVYDKVDEDYTNLLKQTEEWKDKANREKSPEAFRMYQTYADQLASYAADLSKYGLNANNRRGLMGMKAGYARNIEPISQAYDAMTQANALRDNAGPDAIFQVSRYDSIDNFLHGQVANNQRESRADITNRTANMIKAAVQSMVDHPDIINSKSKQFLEVIKGQRGNDMNALLKAIENDPMANNIFTDIKKQMMKEVGIEDYDAVGRRAIDGAINAGLYQGLDNITTEIVGDGEYMSAAERAQDARARQANATQARSVALQEKEFAEKQKYQDLIYSQENGGSPIGTNSQSGNPIYHNTYYEWEMQQSGPFTVKKGQYYIENSDGTIDLVPAQVPGAKRATKDINATKGGRTHKNLRRRVTDEDINRAKLSASANNTGNPFNLMYTSPQGSPLLASYLGQDDYAQAMDVGLTNPFVNEQGLPLQGKPDEKKVENYGKAKSSNSNAGSKNDIYGINGRTPISFDSWNRDLSSDLDFRGYKTIDDKIVYEHAKAFSRRDTKIFDLYDYLSMVSKTEGTKQFNDINNQIQRWNKNFNTDLNIRDFTLWVDWDRGTDSHFMIVPKGYIVNKDNELQYAPEQSVPNMNSGKLWDSDKFKYDLKYDQDLLRPLAIEI